MKKRSLKTVIIAISVLVALTVCSVFASAYTFTDVTNYKEAIEALSGLEIIKGYSDTTFAPNDNITRVQMAILLSKMRTGDVKTSTWEAATASAIPFSDVSADPSVHHYPTAIMYAYNNNIIKGRGDGTFDPTATITVQEAAVMIVRALYYPASAYDSGDWSANYIEKADELKIFEGVNKLKYDPTTVLNRGQVAQLLYNALYAPMYGSTTANVKTFAEEVFKVQTGVKMVVVATSNQKLVAGVEKPGSGYVLMAELKANGTYGTTHTFKVSDLGITAPDTELGNLYTIKSSTQTGYTYEIVGSYKKTPSVTYNSGDKAITVTSQTGTITFDGTTYTPVNNYSYELVDGAAPASRQVIIYGINTLFTQTSPAVLTAANMENKTAAYTFKTFDDNADGYIDRAIFTPFSIGKYSTANGHVTITNAGVKKIDRVVGAITVTNTAAKTLSDGSYVLYSYNPQTMVLEVGDVFTPVSGKITSYINGTIVIDGSKSYTIGYAQMPGASQADIFADSQSVLVSGYTISYVYAKNYIIAIDATSSQTSTYESQSPTAVVTDIDVTTKANGYITLSVLTYDNSVTSIKVTRINSMLCDLITNINAQIAKGDIVEYSADSSSSSSDARYNVTNITSKASYYTTSAVNISAFKSSALGLVSIGNISAASQTSSLKQWYTDPEVAFIYNNGSTIAKYSLDALPTNTLNINNAIYVSYFTANNTFAKLIYIRPTTNSGNPSQPPLTSSAFDSIVYIGGDVIAAATPQTMNGKFGFVLKDAINVQTGSLVTVFVESAGATNPLTTTGYYKVYNSVVVDINRIETDASYANLTLVAKLGAPGISGTGSPTYTINFQDNSTYSVSSLKIFGIVGNGDIECNSTTKLPINYFSDYAQWSTIFQRTQVTTIFYNTSTKEATIICYMSY